MGRCGRTWVLALCTAGAGAGCFSGGDGSVSPSTPSDVVTGVDAATRWDDAGRYVGPGSLISLSLCQPGGCDGGELCASGVCVSVPPEGEVAQTVNPDTHQPTGVAPTLGCELPVPGGGSGPETATLYGAVSRFGGGGVTRDVLVEVFLAETFDPSLCEGETSEAARADCYQDYGSYLTDPANAHGPQALGSALSVSAVPVDSDGEALPESCAGHHDCPLGYQCFEMDLDHQCLESFGLYEVEGVPTNVPLVVRSRATVMPQKWHDTYVFNMMLLADEVVDGRLHYDLTMVSHGQWLLTPNTVNLGDVPATRGIVGGRVRDCRVPGVHASWPVAGVSVALAEPARRVVYFNSLEDDTVPLIDRLTTNALGRFAALDIAPGWNRIAGVARADGEPVTVGGVDIYVFPDALTVLTWPGMQPRWSQQ